MAISFGAPIRTQTPSGTSHTINIGTPSAGDAILIVGVLNRFTLGSNVLSGYVDVVSETAGSGADCFVALKIAGASEPNPVLTTGSATAGDFHVVHVSGVDASTPIAQTELETDQPSGTSVTTATLASVGTGEAVVAIAVVLDDRRALSVDGALTEVAAPNNGDSAQGAWGYEVFPSGGSSVSYTFGFGGITEQAGSFIFSLNPASGAAVVSTTNVLQPPADVDFWGTVAGYPPAAPAESVFDDSTFTVVDGDQYAVRIDSGLLDATLAADGVLEADTAGSLTRWILDASGTGVDGEWYGPGTVTIVDAATLAVQDSVHAHTSDEAALSSGLILAAGDSVHGHAAEVVTLVVAATLTAGESVHAHVADSVALLQAATLAAADSAHAHVADEPTLSSGNNLAPGDSLHAHASDEPALVQASSLSPSDSVHAHAADEPGISVSDFLVPGDSLHGHTVDVVDLGYAAVLSIEDALHAHTVDELQLTQASVLAVGDSLHDHSAEGPALLQSILLAPADSVHGHTADGVVLTEAALLAVQDALHAHFADEPQLLEGAVLVVGDSLHAHLADNIVLPGTVFAAGRLMVVRGTDRLMVVAPTDRLMVVRH